MHFQTFQMSQLVFNPFKLTSDPPRSLAYFYSLSWTLVCFLFSFLYMMLSIPLFTLQSPTLDPD